MPGDKGRAFGRPLLATFYTAFPFEHCPSLETILGELRKNGFEVDLAVSQRAEAPGSICPGLIPTVNALPSGWTKFRIFYVEHLYAAVVKIDELEVIELLQDEMAGVIQHVAARVMLNTIQKNFKSDAVVQVFAGMYFER